MEAEDRADAAEKRADAAEYKAKLLETQLVTYESEKARLQAQIDAAKAHATQERNALRVQVVPKMSA